MLLTAARVLEAALALAAIFVGVRSPRHRVFAAWICFSLAYSLADKLWITPILGSLPRPYTGGARLFLHASQAFFIASHVMVAAVTFHLVRAPAIIRPLPWFIGFVAFVVLVDGYAHSPGPGQYAIAGHVFRSRSIYLVVRAAGPLMALGALLPRFGLHLEETRETDDTAILASVLAVATAGAAGVVASVAWPRSEDAVGHALYIAGYAVALGVHAPVVYLHLLGASHPEFQRRIAIANRRTAIYTMGERLPASRAAFAEACRSGAPGPSGFPVTMPLAVRAKRSREFEAMIAQDLAVAGAVEFMLAVVSGLSPHEGARLVEGIARALDSAADRLEASSEGEFAWMALLEEPEIGRGSFLAPISIVALSTMRGLTWSEARTCVETAAAIARGAWGDTRESRRALPGDESST